jgi:hypothetical protein
MAKWADYLISEVKHSDDFRRIEKVKVHEDLGEKVGKGVCIESTSWQCLGGLFAA